MTMHPTEQERTDEWAAAIKQVSPGAELKRADPWTDARKYDQDKLRFDLIPAYPLEELAAIYTFGANKYQDRNWEKGIKWSRIFAAIMRHLWAMWRGEWLDPESGIAHVSHAAWGCFALAEYYKTKPEFDDRPTPPPKDTP